MKADESFGDGLDDHSQEESEVTSPRSSAGTSRRRKSRDAPETPPDDFDVEAKTDSPSTRRKVSDQEDAEGAAEEYGDPELSVDAPGADDGDEGDRRPRRRRRRRRRSGGTEPGGGDSSRADNRGSNAGRGGRRRQSDRGGTRGGGRTGSSSDRGRRGGAGGSASRRSRQIQSSGEEIEGTFEGVLELHPKGYGFLRDPRKNYAAEDSNPFVSSSIVEKFALREGVLIRGDVGPGTRNQGPRLREVELIDGFTPEEYTKVKHFDELTPINPFEQIRLETGPRPITMRVMDLLCPIGKGQRALLVAPPRTGKTMLLQDIANAVSENHPEIHLMVLLIDERPEEVTEMNRLVNGEVISSSLDQDVESHVRIAQLIIERGKRLAESGKDVFILLDSITRLARAFNKWVSNSGRTGSGGLDIRALDMPKKLFGTARRFDEGGSLTVCGTALIETTNRMDEAIFQEFKGTGNMEMVLSRDLADRRIWPSIDIAKSGTRREEKILAPDVLEGVTLLRRSLITLSPVEAMEQLTRTMEKFPTNAEFLTKIRHVL
ncbi:MAG: transcription termination factor Rho [Planctomycetaceae bacterium]